MFKWNLSIFWDKNLCYLEIFNFLQQKSRFFSTLTLVSLHVNNVQQKMLICLFQVIARIVDGSKFDEFKTMYGETLVTGKLDPVMFIIKRKFDSLIHDSTVVKKIGTRMKLSN